MLSYTVHMQLLPSIVLDFEKDQNIMQRMHDYKMYPPRFTIAVHGEGATAPSRVKVEFTGVDRKLSSVVILPLPVQLIVRQKTTGIVCITITIV